MRRQHEHEELPERDSSVGPGSSIERRISGRAGKTRAQLRPDVRGCRTLGRATRVSSHRAASPAIEHRALSRERQHAGLEVALRMSDPGSRLRMLGQPRPIVHEEIQPAALLIRAENLVMRIADAGEVELPLGRRLRRKILGFSRDAEGLTACLSDHVEHTEFCRA